MIRSITALGTCVWVSWQFSLRLCMRSLAAGGLLQPSFRSPWRDRRSSEVGIFEDAAKKIAAKDRALLTAAGQTLLERRDERIAVAGELHDEVLPPLFKVHLMGQVLRQDSELWTASRP